MKNRWQESWDREFIKNAFLSRDYKYIDGYLDELIEDIYKQPPDEEHTEQAQLIIDNWIPRLEDCVNVLDVGCGEGFCSPFFEKYGLEYTGVCLGDDYVEAKKLDINVMEEDFHFLPFSDETYDIIFARHALEHSPMPLIALMEWHRVARQYLIVVLPKPKFWLFIGRNHYSVVTKSQARYLLHRAGWHILEEDHEHTWEYRFLCRKRKRMFMPEEGYVWAYEDDDLNWLDIIEPVEELETV